MVSEVKTAILITGKNFVFLLQYLLLAKLGSEVHHYYRHSLKLSWRVLHGLTLRGPMSDI